MKLEANHALLCGLIHGALLRMAADQQHTHGWPDVPHTTIEPIMDAEGYTNRVLVHRPSGSYLVTVEAVAVVQPEPS